MSERLMPLLLIILLSSLMVTPVRAMDCERISQLTPNSGTELTILDKNFREPRSRYEGYLEPTNHREEYDILLKTIASYNVCMDKEIKNILSEIASSVTEGTHRAQSILTIEEKLTELQKANENIHQQLLQQYHQFVGEVKSSDETFRELIKSLEQALATQMRDIEGVDDELESKLESNASKIGELSERLTGTDKRMGIGLSDLGKTLSTQMADLEGVDDELELTLESNSSKIRELSQRLTSTDNKMGIGLSDLDKTLSVKTLYGIISILVVTLLGILLFMVLRKSILNQRIYLEGMKKEIMEESIGLDNKLVSLIENQLSIEGSKGNSSGQIDHSLAIKVADEIARIQKNTLQMDTATKGLKQLLASVKRIQDNFSSNGYDIVEMLDQPYDEGMNALVNFILDENLNENEQVITRIIKPQVNYQGVMIQAAQIEVSKGE